MFTHIKEDIKCVFDRDPAARNWFEVITTYPGIHAIQAHRLSHWFWRKNFKWLAKMLSTVARFGTGIEIHPGATIGRRFFIDHGMGIVIGETAEIGDDCTLYHGVTLGGTSWESGKRHPTLENGVVVGAGAKVLGPIIVRSEARIGSNAVVVKDVPSGASVVGVPGRIVVRKLVEEQSEKRQAIASKMGFDAYGTTYDMPDPVANAVNKMLDHIHAMDEKQEQIYSALKKMGVQIQDVELPELDSCELSDGENKSQQTKKKAENAES